MGRSAGETRYQREGGGSTESTRFGMVNEAASTGLAAGESGRAGQSQVGATCAKTRFQEIALRVSPWAGCESARNANCSWSSGSRLGYVDRAELGAVRDGGWARAGGRRRVQWQQQQLEQPDTRWTEAQGTEPSRSLLFETDARLAQQATLVLRTHAGVSKVGRCSRGGRAVPFSLFQSARTYGY